MLESFILTGITHPEMIWLSELELVGLTKVKHANSEETLVVICVKKKAIELMFYYTNEGKNKCWL